MLMASSNLKAFHQLGVRVLKGNYYQGMTFTKYRLRLTDAWLYNILLRFDLPLAVDTVAEMARPRLVDTG